LAASFFEHQASAHRRTRVLVLLYLLAVAGVVFAVDILLSVIYLYVHHDGSFGIIQAAQAAGGWARLVPGEVLIWGAVVTAGVIFSVSLGHILKLAGKGEEVAHMVGARAVAPNTADALERRLLNVVEEMAIAAGVRVPKAYIMDDERGINAFAAGYDVSNAVVAITRGTLETLNRDELQGVIGHEFSHILNGDMRLNVRMLGVLEGIVFLSAIGAFLMRNSGRVRGRNSGGIVLAMLAVGLALFVIGYIGLFFARLIKAAVSRQREFLADASSVQFTRNPDGLAGALDQIAAAPSGARISNRYAEEMAHMYFGQAISVWLGGIFDTHPPLAERIARVRPGFQRSRYRARRQTELESDAAAREISGEALPAAAVMLSSGERRADDRRAPWLPSPSQSANLVGQLDPGKMDYAARLLAALPEVLRNRVREPEGARAAVIALLLANQTDLLRAQVEALKARGMNALAEAALALESATRDLGPSFRLALVDLALPAIKLAAADAKQELIAAAKVAIGADRRVSLQEFIVLTLVRTQIEERGHLRTAKFATISAARESAILLISLIAQAGARGETAADLEKAASAAFQAGAREAQLQHVGAYTRSTVTFDSVTKAFEELRGLAPLAKARLIKGLFAATIHDRSMRIVEADLLRLAGAVLDCPLPPLLDEIDPAHLAE
jgi:Zn-dependent protease with chaperone function